MATVVRFSDGQLLDVQVQNETETLFHLSLNATHIRHCAVIYIDGDLKVYRLLRRCKRVGPVRSTLNNIEENLAQHYQFVLKGLVWGQPSITRIKGRYWWCLNELLIIDELGNISQPLQDILDRYELPPPSTETLLNYFKSVRDGAVFHKPSL